MGIKEKILEIIAGLLKPSSVYALIIYLTFSIMALTGKIKPEIVENVMLVIVAFYFGKRSSENGKPQ